MSPGLMRGNTEGLANEISLFLFIIALSFSSILQLILLNSFSCCPWNVNSLNSREMAKLFQI